MLRTDPDARYGRCPVSMHGLSSCPPPSLSLSLLQSQWLMTQSPYAFPSSVLLLFRVSVSDHF